MSNGLDMMEMVCNAYETPADDDSEPGGGEEEEEESFDFSARGRSRGSARGGRRALCALLLSVSVLGRVAVCACMCAHLPTRATSKGRVD